MDAQERKWQIDIQGWKMHPGHAKIYLGIGKSKNESPNKYAYNWQELSGSMAFYTSCTNPINNNTFEILSSRAIA
eukprot:1157422-Pelagomonas_calceolata.AAC.1